MRRPGTMQELALPVSSFRALRAALEDSVGAEAAADALRRAGHAAGDALVPLLAPGTGENAPEPGSLPETAFWRRIADLFAARGWGRLEFHPVHAGIGALEAADWVEAEAADDRLNPSCHFTTGLLANLLGQAAGTEIGVLEVECRSRGDLCCRFLFGGHDALDTLHAGLVQGQPLEQALAQLV